MELADAVYQTSFGDRAALGPLSKLQGITIVCQFNKPNILKEKVEKF